MIVVMCSAACGSVTSSEVGDGDGDGDGDDAGAADGAACASGVFDCAGVCDGEAVVDNCGVCAVPRPSRWPDSVTRVCNDGASELPCPIDDPAGQDGNYVVNPPDYAADAGTVTDSVTGLIWERDPAYVDTTKDDAVARCDALELGGATDWRLPTRLELLSLVDAGRRVPPWPQVFVGIPQNSFFWSSTADPVDANNSLAINTNFAVVRSRLNGTATGNLSRCVRDASIFSEAVRADGAVVVDERTNLVWQDEIAEVAMSWQDAMALCEGLTLNGSSEWRLPNHKELGSIVDDTRTDPAISPAFTDRPAEFFWSSTPVPLTNGAYATDFATGRNPSIDPAFATLFRARCVCSP